MLKLSSGQSSFLIKSLFTVIAAALFIFLIYSFSSFRANVIEQKSESDFKVSVLNILQKLMGDESCLAYKEGSPQKPILSKDKIDQFATSYKSAEPTCAKAIDFDYAIRIIQLPYNFTLLPGEKKILGELKLSNEFSSHPYGSDSSRAIYFDCNFNPQDHPELCQTTELDLIVCPDCLEDPRVKCPYPHSGATSPWAPPGVCCVYYSCPRDACETSETKPGKGDCSSGCIVSTNCNTSRCEFINYFGAYSGWHGACGMTYDYIIVPAGETKYINIAQNIWEFGLSFGQTSFSQGKAKYNEMELSLPITIRYNETFSTEGSIYIYAVRGELEDLSSMLDDICEKAKVGMTDIKFTKEFHFSYPVSYDNSTSKLCMGSNCKTFICPSSLEFQDIEKDGDYQLSFSFDPTANKIIVRR